MQPLSIVIAVATYRRPEHVAQLLPLLLAQSRQCREPVRIVVADNDREGSARDAVAPWLAHDVDYVLEPEPGLAAVRNRLLDEAGGADLLAFIDDDERPGDGWLDHLLGCWQRYRCAVISGPVRSEFEQEPDSWVRASGMFERRRRPTGTSLAGAATNNLLLDLRWLREAGLRFDPAFGESGGEDTMLTHSIVAHGGVIRWCDEAEVSELVPSARVSRRWVRQRVFRSANSWARVHLAIAGTSSRRVLWMRIELAAQAAKLALLWLGNRLRCLIRPDVGRDARAIVDFERSAGVFHALLNRTIVEYSR